MSFSSLRAAMLALALAAPVVLGACSGLRPVYGEPASVVERVELAYSKPGSRLEQIVIETLKLRLGASDAAGVPSLTVTASSSTRGLTSTRVTKPFTQREVTVTARYRLSAGGRLIGSGSRTASASYGTSGQVMADEAALKDATERAGVAAAEAVRLAVLALLSNPTRLAQPL